MIEKLLSPFFKEIIIHENNKYIFQKSFFKFKKENIDIKLDLKKTYLAKPLVVLNNEVIFPEIALVKIFNFFNWNAFWIDSFHKKLWFGMPPNCELKNIPESANSFLKGFLLNKNIYSQGAWDIFAWNQRKCYFIECKGVPSNDKIRNTQINFYTNALKNGLNNSDFIIIEWDYE